MTILDYNDWKNNGNIKVKRNRILSKLNGQLFLLKSLYDNLKGTENSVHSLQEFYFQKSFS